ncbi:MAG TPA: nicotinamide riboside transporter PnuC [Bacteroidia bacterium]|nr:nicotinamide riboside transporter PnuC [Bacteroidia bacterium]
MQLQELYISNILQYISTNTLEWIGALFGIAGIYLTTKAKVACFPIGIVSVAASWFLFIKEGFYANALLQLFFALMLIYGWWSWTRKKNDRTIKITRSGWDGLALYTLAGIAVGLLFGYYFTGKPDSNVPYADGLTTGLSFAAQWMVARKKSENWILWIITNTIYVIMYWYTHLPVYATLYLVYLLLAIQGWYNWQKEYTKNLSA